MIFDHWGGCHLYAGVTVSAIADSTKEKLRHHAGKAVVLDVRRLRPYFSTSGDFILQEYEVLGPAEEDRKSPAEPKIDGLRLSAKASFESDAAVLILEVRNTGNAPAELRMDYLAPSRDGGRSGG